MPKRLLPKPFLILVMGVAGSGKTTLSHEIVRRISAVYLDNNHVADAFFPDTRNSTRYTKLRSHIYNVLYTVTEENLKLGNSVLLDVPHVKEIQSGEWRNFIKRLVRRTKSKLIIIKCVCSEEVLRKRIRSRGKKRDNWKLNHWSKFLRQQPLDVAIPFPHLAVNTEKTLSRNVTDAIRHIMSSIG